MHLSMQLRTVGEIVRVLRSRRGLEQVELARSCGWRDASAVSRIETDRIRPTRRTLMKLSENLADSTTGPSSEILGWLFLAAGVLPTAREIDHLLPTLPAIDTWMQPAIITDFGWYTWRANEAFRTIGGLPENYLGRNFLEMIFEPGGSIRAHMDSTWEEAAANVVHDFRVETDGRVEQRWHKKLLASLQALPDFTRIWSASTIAKDSAVFNWSTSSIQNGAIGLVRSHVVADPRFSVTQLVPENLAGNEFMLKLAASQR